jgi:hypothetical protein
MPSVAIAAAASAVVAKSFDEIMSELLVRMKR